MSSFRRSVVVSRRQTAALTLRMRLALWSQTEERLKLADSRSPSGMLQSAGV